MIKLEEQLAALLITRQVLGNLQEALWPLINQSLNTSKRVSFKLEDHKKTDEDSYDDEESLSNAEKECLLNIYESTYEDYLEMFTQFGNVVLFSGVFPLASVCALFNNIIEIRSDAFKLCVTHQRPFAGSRVKDIGQEWFQAMNLLVYLSIIVNCAMLVKSGLIQRLFPFLDDLHVILAAVVVEHIMIGLKVLIDRKKHLPFFTRLLLVTENLDETSSI
jgi:anoctamin-8